MRSSLSLLILVLFFSPITSGQNTGSRDLELETAQYSVAPVKVDGRTVFYVHGIQSVPADQRAAAIADRIVKAARDRSITKDSVKLVEGADRHVLFAGRHFIMNVYDLDAGTGTLSRSIIAEMAATKLKSAIDMYRYERSRPAIIKDMLFALGTLLITTLLLLLFTWLLKKLQLRLEKRIQTWIDGLESKSYKLIRSNQLWGAYNVFFKTLRIVVIVIVTAGMLQYILGLFPWTNHIADYTLGLFLDPLSEMGLGVLNYLPSLAFLIVIFLVARYLLKLIKLLFRGIQEGGIKIANFDPEWSMSTFKILRLVILIFAFVIAYPYIPGSSSDAFKGISVFFGLLLSLGSSSFISNIIAGYSMTYRGAFKKGDLIKTDDVVGFVEEQKLMVTCLRSLKNEEIIIPNSSLLNSNILNYTAKAKTGGLIIHTMVGIGYETPWRQVDAMLKQAADRTEGILKDPPPFVIKQSLGDFAVNYEINAYITDVARMKLLYNLLHQNILDVFNEHNVQIMTPAYEGDPEVPKVVPRDQWYAPPATSDNTNPG